MTVYDWELWIEVRHRIPPDHTTASDYWASKGLEFEDPSDAGEWVVVDDLMGAPCLERVDLLGALQGGHDFESVLTGVGPDELGDYLSYFYSGWDRPASVATLAEIRATDWDERAEVLGYDHEGKFVPVTELTYQRTREEDYLAARERVRAEGPTELDLVGTERVFRLETIPRDRFRSERFPEFVDCLASLTNDRIAYEIRPADVRFVKGPHTG